MSNDTQSQSAHLKTLGAAGAGLGATLAATLATVCCVPILAPLIVTVLGVSGAVWAAGLKPYSLHILTASLAVLAYGFWMIYRPRKVPEGSTCAARRPRAVVWMIWIAALIWVFALILNVLPGLLLGLAQTLEQT